MYERLIHQVTSILRGSIGTDEFFPLAFQLLAWVRASRLGRLEGRLAFNRNDAPRDAKHLGMIFQEIGNSELLGANSAAFSYVSPALQHLSAGQLLQALDLLADSNLEEPWAADSLLSTISGRLGRGLLGLPKELSELMVALTRVESGDAVYLPYEQSFQLTAGVQNVTPRTYSETPTAGPFPWLINLLSDLNAEIHVGDSLEKPGFLEEGRLAQFDASLSFPPFGVRYDSSLAELDRFGRFPEKTSAIAVLAIRHLLARTRGRIVIAVPNGVLFSPGAERSLRDDLLALGRIEAVIALPPALLAGTALQFSLLALRADSRCEQIVFVDGCNEAFYSKDGKGRATLTGWQSIAETVFQGIDGPASRTVSVRDVQANDSQLQVSRYCKTSDADAVDELLNKYPTKTLGELVTIVRPIPLSPQEGAVSVFEVGPADFPEYGYAMIPGREIKLSETNVTKGRKQFLRHYDIAIAIKGSVGKVAILPPELPGEGDARWVIGQSCLVLRSDDGGMIDPRVLFSFLKSTVGQAQLRQIVSGASVPLIQLRELEKIRIPIPERAVQEQAIATFEKIVEIERLVANSRNEQRQLSNSIWNI